MKTTRNEGSLRTAQKILSEICVNLKIQMKMTILRTAQKILSGICVNLEIQMKKTNINIHKIHYTRYTTNLQVKQVDSLWIGRYLSRYLLLWLHVNHFFFGGGGCPINPNSPKVGQFAVRSSHDPGNLNKPSFLRWKCISSYSRHLKIFLLRGGFENVRGYVIIPRGE